MHKLRSGIAILALAVAATSVPAAAAAAAPAVVLHLPAGNLGDSLRALGQAANQQILFPESDVRAISAPALDGSYTIDQALARLLAGTGLRATRTSAGLFVIKPEQEASRGQPSSPAVQSAASAPEAAPSEPSIVVTGSRIRRASPDTAAPITQVSGADLTDRGYVQAGDMLNQVTSNLPSFPNAPFSGFPAGSGQTYPNLFGLGPGRTLTLVNGRRMVTSASGLGDRTVDVNTIPAGLIDHIDVVEAGGAAVYGSDAIAGVVNYVLKRNYSGIELDAQDTIRTDSGRSAPSLRLTAGTNFAGGGGNIAADVEYSRTDPLLETDVPYFRDAPRSVTNPLNTSQSDGQPPTIIVYDGRLWRYNKNGVIFAANGTAASNLLLVGGSPVQFSPDGTGIVPYDTGIIQLNNSSTAIGGDGNDPRYLSTLATGVERYTGSLLGHYDLTEHVRLSGEFLYSHERGTDALATEDIARFVGGGGSFSAIPFTRDNPYLTASQLATLTAASPAFAAGSPLYLSKFFDILPTRAGTTDTGVGRGLISLDGDFMLGSHKFYWSISGSHGETRSKTSTYAQYVDHFNNAVNAARNGAGQIVCAINADASTANDDPACVPFDPFGNTIPSQQVIDYVATRLQDSVRNKQDDFLATIGGELITLPAGKLQFSAAYEHRRESAVFTPGEAELEGLAGFSSSPESGRYHTNEYSGELLIPLVGGDFTLPLVKALELSGSFRHVDNSLAGSNNVWGFGGRWTVGAGITLRGSRSRNFSAPTLDQQLAPSTVNPGNPAQDPCDRTLINSGPNPAVRLANCQAQFAANPGWGPLASFNDPAINTGLVALTETGNPNLRNEVSNTLTLGVQFDPPFIPGLSASADYIKIDLTDAISFFGINDFLSACYDINPQPAAICSTFARDPTTGYLVSGTEETFNAGLMKFRGEVYKLNYHLPLSRLFAGSRGAFDFHVEALHNRFFETSVTGFDQTRSDGTVSAPDWRVRFDLSYSRGPFKIFYSLYYLPSAKANFTATIETTPIPVVASNMTHTVSVQYDLGHVTLRAGVDNLTNKYVSIPTRTYGDLYGRRVFVGARVHF